MKKDTSLHVLGSGDEAVVNVFNSFEKEKTPEKVAQSINIDFCFKLVLKPSKKFSQKLKYFF